MKEKFSVERALRRVIKAQRKMIRALEVGGDTARAQAAIDEAYSDLDTCEEYRRPLVGMSMLAGRCRHCGGPTERHETPAGAFLGCNKCERAWGVE